MALVEIKPGLVVSNKGIKSIKLMPKFGKEGHDLLISYIGGHTESIGAEEMSMEELLVKLGRSPRAEGGTDSRRIGYIG